MKSWLALVVLILAGASSASLGEEASKDSRYGDDFILDGIPQLPESVVDLRPYHRIRTASFHGWLPDGSGMLIATHFGDKSQIHVVKEPGGDRRQVTFSEEGVEQAVPTRIAARAGLVYVEPPAPGEPEQVSFLDLRAKTVRHAADARRSEWSAACANKGGRCVFSTTLRNGRDWDLYVLDVDEPGPPVPLLTDGGAWSPIEWSPDDTRLLAVRYLSDGNVLFGRNVLYHVIDAATGRATPVGKAEDGSAYGDAAFAPDGKGIFIASDEGSEFKTLRYYDLATASTRRLPGEAPWDVEEIEVSGDGRYLAFTTNEDGIDRLHVRRLPGMENVPLPVIPAGLIRGLAFGPDGHPLGLELSTPGIPGDVFSLDPDKGTLTRWTHSEAGGLDEDRFVTPELIHYETFDRVNGAPRRIPAFYYRPRGAGPFPVVVKLHGGPADQEKLSFDAFDQYVVNELGVALLLPNVRGSTGYGKAYVDLDNGLSREDAVKDVGALLDWIGTQPELDAGRVVVSGGSYGGYLSLAAMVAYGDRLRAGIALSAISDFLTYLEGTAPYRLGSRRAEYGDEREAETRAFLERISPLPDAGRIRRPMLIVHGLKDERVPVGEGEQIVRAMRGNLLEVWFLKAKDEGHSFKQESRELYRAVVVLFLKAQLGLRAAV